MLGLHTGECGRRRAKLRFEWAVFSFTNVWYAKTKKGLAFVEIEAATRFAPLPGYDHLLPRYAFPEIPSVEGNRGQERSDARRDRYSTLTTSPQNMASEFPSTFIMPTGRWVPPRKSMRPPLPGSGCQRARGSPRELRPGIRRWSSPPITGAHSSSPYAPYTVPSGLWFPRSGFGSSSSTGRR